MDGSGFSRSHFGSVCKIGFFCTLMASLSVLIAGQGLWLSGIWAAFFWLFINSFLFHYVLRLAGQGNARMRKALSLTLVVKFPVLYLIGFWFLITPAVSNEGILVGFTAYLTAGILVWLRSFKRIGQV